MSNNSNNDLPVLLRANHKYHEGSLSQAQNNINMLLSLLQVHYNVKKITMNQLRKVINEGLQIAYLTGLSEDK